MDRTRTAVRVVPASQRPATSAAEKSTGRLSLAPTTDIHTPVFPEVEVPRAFNAYLAEPLPQRPAGSIGKSGQCALVFHVRQEKTYIQRSFVSHPFHFTHPWHLDPALPDMAVVYVQAPAGGLIQGDRAAMQFSLASGARVHVTTQAAEKIHTMTANCAVQQITFTLAADAYAEYCPEPVILFPGSRFAQEVHVELGTNAWFFLAELFLVPAGLAPFDALSTCLTVRETKGKVLLHERGVALPTKWNLDGPGILNGHRVWGQAVLSGPQIPPAQIKDLATLIADQPGVICGASSLPRERGVVVKVVGTQVPVVRQVLYTAWNFLRLQWLQAPATLFPK